MSDILNSAAQTANAATNPGERINDPGVSRGRTHNRFDLGYSNFMTARFGDILPFFVMESVEGDKTPLSSQHEVRSFTMSAPLMSRIRMCKDNYFVPLPAILRKNWDILYRNPSHGDDTPADAWPVIPNTLTSNFLSRIKRLYEIFVGHLAYTAQGTPTVYTAEKQLSYFLRGMFFFEQFFSTGSLLNVLGAHLHACFTGLHVEGLDTENPVMETLTFDQVFESVLDAMKESPFKFTIDSVSYAYVPASLGVNYDTTNCTVVSFHRMIELLRENPQFKFAAADLAGTAVETALKSFYDGASLTIEDTSLQIVVQDKPFNYSRCLAYQCVCSQFYTNDKVDYLYTYQLYEDAAFAVLRDVVKHLSGSDDLYFTYNGVSKLYDVFAGHNLDYILDKMEITFGYDQSDTVNFPYLVESLVYVNYIFGIRRSLKYADYFCGSRPTPLAVGDVNAPVVDNKVSAIDMTSNILKQRFLNACMKVGSRISDYIDGIMNGRVAPDYHEPKFISHSIFNVGQQEVENTSSQNQGALVQNLISTADKYEFEVNVDMPGILISVLYFDCPRAYSRTMDKFFFKADRFDMFNPYFQNIGDQEISGYELNAARAVDTNFGYQTRHAEYKQRYSIASGGFVNDLPAWSFLADNKDSSVPIARNELVVINPEYIRNSASDFDRFYSSLTGSTLGNYFHFILRVDNLCPPLRPMEYSPTIL